MFQLVGRQELQNQVNDIPVKKYRSLQYHTIVLYLNGNIVKAGFTEQGSYAIMQLDVWNKNGLPHQKPQCFTLPAGNVS